MFLEDEEMLDIVIYHKKVGKHYVAYGEESFNKIGMSEDEKKEFNTLNIKARQLTWGLYNDLQESAMVPDELGNRKWNYKVYKESKLKSIIVKWDAKIKNEEGKMVDIPPTSKAIAKMAPDIAEAILNIYDKITIIDEDEEKKS
jgi:hypothetical protein